MNQQDLTNLLKRSLHTIETLKECLNKQHKFVSRIKNDSN
jgi:hypothetical protein